jgi:hypothetical protein
MNLSLKYDLYPLAEHLVWTQQAKIIDPIGPKLRTSYLPDTTRNRA